MSLINFFLLVAVFGFATVLAFLLVKAIEWFFLSILDHDGLDD